MRLLQGEGRRGGVLWRLLHGRQRHGLQQLLGGLPLRLHKLLRLLLLLLRLRLRLLPWLLLPLLQHRRQRSALRLPGQNLLQHKVVQRRRLLLLRLRPSSTGCCRRSPSRRTAHPCSLQQLTVRGELQQQLLPLLVRSSHLIC